MTAGTHQAKSDFFERLIDKALRTDAGVAPRLRSLFEPVPPAAPANWLEETENDTTAVPAAHRSQEVPTEPRRLLEPDRKPSRDIAARPAENESSTIFVDAAIDDHSPELAVPRAPARLVAPDPVDAAPSAPRAVAAAPLAPDRAPASVSLAPARRRDENAQGDAVPSDAPALPQLVPDSRLIIERVFAAPSPAAQRRQPDDRYGEPSQAPAAPSVNITIGRVEVRAVSAPAAKPRVEPRGRQPLGLDEYLKRRGAR
jgi:hypothetical protein